MIVIIFNAISNFKLPDFRPVDDSNKFQLIRPVCDPSNPSTDFPHHFESRPRIYLAAEGDTRQQHHTLSHP